jgi:hypothetical protein
MTLRKLAEGTYDPATGGAPAPTATDYTVIGVLLQYSDMYINGSTILRQDRRCIIAAKGMTVVPELGDRIIADGVTYAVLEVVVKEVSAVPATYVMQIRRGSA